MKPKNWIFLIILGIVGVNLQAIILIIQSKLGNHNFNWVTFSQIILWLAYTDFMCYKYSKAKKEEKYEEERKKS